eukprot:GHVS01095161.1.p1 GENE.GHVS01095161.1~~GHVS01095161.1.p1  ORF type:complete len:171 (-),score=18.88 GHVS01095161.1:56-493(-)
MFLLSRRSAFFALFVILAFAATTLLAPDPDTEETIFENTCKQGVKDCLNLDPDEPYYPAAFSGMQNDFAVKAVRATGTVFAKYRLLEECGFCMATDLNGTDQQQVTGITRKVIDDGTIQLTLKLAEAQFKEDPITTAIIIELKIY